MIKQLINPEIFHHIYAIATQECLRTIPESLLNSSKDEWINKIQLVLGENFSLINSRTLMATNLLIFVSKTVINLISNIESDLVSNGLGNLFGNKGATAISFYIGGTSLLFVSLHLAGNFI